jgi:hypothetical protein
MADDLILRIGESVFGLGWESDMRLDFSGAARDGIHLSPYQFLVVAGLLPSRGPRGVVPLLLPPPPDLQNLVKSGLGLGTDRPLGPPILNLVLVPEAMTGRLEAEAPFIPARAAPAATCPSPAGGLRSTPEKCRWIESVLHKLIVRVAQREITPAAADLPPIGP